MVRARIFTYECEQCGSEIIVTPSGETQLSPIYCCGIKVTEISSEAKKPSRPKKKTAKKTVKKAHALEPGSHAVLELIGGIYWVEKFADGRETREEIDGKSVLQLILQAIEKYAEQVEWNSLTLRQQKNRMAKEAAEDIASAMAPVPTEAESDGPEPE